MPKSEPAAETLPDQQVPTPAAQPEDKADPLTAQPKLASIRVIGPEQGRWRGQYGTARRFTPEPQFFTEESGLSGEEIVELMGDPELKVAFLDADGNELPAPDLAQGA